MPVKLQDSVVVVTGGARGIGRAIAEACIIEGAKVVLTGRSKEALRATAQALVGEVFVVVGDMTREVDVARTARAVQQKYGQVDALVNNAGSAESAPFLKMKKNLWDKMLAANATSAFLVTRAFMPHLIRTKGRIVMVASSAAKHGAPYVSAYCASKHAMLGLTRALAAEFGPLGLRVNAVCPGYVDTPMTGRSVDKIMERTGRSRDEVVGLLGKMNPQHRLLKPEEVAEAVVPLLARECVVNGEAIDL